MVEDPHLQVRAHPVGLESVERSTQLHRQSRLHRNYSLLRRATAQPQQRLPELQGKAFLILMEPLEGGHEVSV